MLLVLVELLVKLFGGPKGTGQGKETSKQIKYSIKIVTNFHRSDRFINRSIHTQIVAGL